MKKVFLILSLFISFSSFASDSDTTATPHAYLTCGVFASGYKLVQKLAFDLNGENKSEDVVVNDGLHFVLEKTTRLVRLEFAKPAGNNETLISISALKRMSVDETFGLTNYDDSKTEQSFTACYFTGESTVAPFDHQ